MAATVAVETANYVALNRLEKALDEYAYSISPEGIQKRVHEVLKPHNIQPNCQPAN